MNNKPGWRKGFGFAQIFALMIVVIPTAIFLMTLLLDYWTVMQLDNRLKMMSHRAIMIINNESNLSSEANVKKSMDDLKAWGVLQSLCPSSKPTLKLSRVGEMNASQTKIEVVIAKYPLNRLGDKNLSSTITSYSYKDQNGSFKLECE
ncbi:MAG: hypothetical protein PHW64_08065 [Sulfuricurvum sp.]|nr:hypothetical protein [Sulfuricurvum sp.]